MKAYYMLLKIKANCLGVLCLLGYKNEIAQYNHIQ